MDFSLPLLFSFISVAAILTMTPGVDTAMVLRACASGGAKPGWFAAIGIALGCLVWGGVVALGLGVILQASNLAYMVVKYLGAGYLFWMGVQLIRHPKRTLENSSGITLKESPWVMLKRGFLTNLLNPKIGVFYLTFLPQFIPAHANVRLDSFILAAIHAVLTLIWFALLITLTAPLTKMLRRPEVISGLDRVAGAVFILFGLKLVFSRA